MVIRGKVAIMPELSTHEQFVHIIRKLEIKREQVCTWPCAGSGILYNNRDFLFIPKRFLSKAEWHFSTLVTFRKGSYTLFYLFVKYIMMINLQQQRPA